MGIRVEHGPSMVPVGQLAYRTGQNEYIDKRRQELEAQQEQQANRNLKSQMQVNDINSGFQQIQMQHEQGMQRAAAQNEFQLDRDQKNNDWQVNAAGELFNRQKELSDQSHNQGLARAEFSSDLRNQAMLDNNQTIKQDKMMDTLYRQSNTTGRGVITEFQSQMQKLYANVGEGKITKEQYKQKYAEGWGSIVTQLTDSESSQYRMGASELEGAESFIHGGTVRQINGNDGNKTFQRNLKQNEDGSTQTDSEWDKENQPLVKNKETGMWEQTVFDWRDGSSSIRDMSHINQQQWTEKQKALEMLFKQREAEQGGAITLDSVNKKVAGLTTAYENNNGPKPVVSGDYPEAELISKLKEWEAGFQAFKNDRMTPEEIRMGGGEPAAPANAPANPNQGKGNPRFLPIKGIDPDPAAIPFGMEGSSQQAPGAPPQDDLDAFFDEQDAIEAMQKGVPVNLLNPATW